MSGRIDITGTVFILEREIREEFVRASGPGGQNVNKVATAVQLRFDVAGSPSLPAAVAERLIKIAGKRVTDDGVLIIIARRYRTQERNREDARQRLYEWIRKASQTPRPRRKTRPSRASIENRLDRKKRHAQKKRTRRSPRPPDEHS